MIAAVAALTGCGPFGETGCDITVASNPRGVVFGEGHALPAPAEVLARRQDIDVAASSVGFDGVGAQRVAVVSLKLAPEAAQRVDALALQGEPGNIAIAIDGIVVLAALPALQPTEDGVVSLVGVPSDAVDLAGVATRCGIPTMTDAP